MRTYRQLTQEQRYQIYALKKTKHTLSETAAVLGVHKSSVSRELRRNCETRLSSATGSGTGVGTQTEGYTKDHYRGLGGSGEIVETRLESGANLWQAEKGTRHLYQS